MSPRCHPTAEEAGPIARWGRHARIPYASGVAREGGQAAVEAALTLPLALFMILGALQLFLMLQGRIMAQYAVARATMMGSLNHGSCEVMTQSAVAALLPSFHAFAQPGSNVGRRYARAFNARRDNRYLPAQDAGHSEAIVWIVREQPRRGDISGNEEDTFDLPERRGGPLLIETRMIYFFPLKIPFANWVMSRILLAHFNVQAFRNANPYLMTEDANWSGGTMTVDGEVATELLARSARRQYVAPIDVTYATRMMSPPRHRYFRQQNCPPTPEGL